MRWPPVARKVEDPSAWNRENQRVGHPGTILRAPEIDSDLCIENVLLMLYSAGTECCAKSGSTKAIKPSVEMLKSQGPVLLSFGTSYRLRC
jgi:hypothetical protein